MNKGGCYCGKIRFEVNGDIRPVVACHCGQCRKISGHFVAASQVDFTDFLLSGDVKWFESSKGYKRGFCPECGTQMFWKADSEDRISIMAGAFDAGTELVSSKHIYVDEKSDYYEINDKLPKYAANGNLMK